MAAEQGPARALRPDYAPPDWAGTPSFRGLAVELIVRGEVRERVELDVEAHQSFCIGRAQNCDVVLDKLEPRASRFHCILQCKQGASELYVFDLNSSHGTLLNGRRLDARSFEPLRVGEQLTFDADAPKGPSCVALICGPAEAMGEETEVDLEALKEKSARDRAEIIKREQADLARRKEAKRKRMAMDNQRKAVVDSLAARAQKKIEARQEAENEDREKLHQVTWGMADDAMDAPETDQTEEAKKLMDAAGRLDPEKVRKLKLTEKQEQMLRQLEQKQKKLANLQREKSRLEGGGGGKSRGKGKGDDDMDTEFDVVERRGGGGANLEKLVGLQEKLEKSEGEINMQTDNLLLSLGLRKAGASGPSKRQAAMYDTRDEDCEDDFFDRTVVRGGGAAAKGGGAKAGEEATELKGLPTLDRVETQASLETKVGLLGAEKARVTVQLAAEQAKERQRKQLAEAAAGEGEDSLEAFMTGTLDELREDRRSKLQRRMDAVEARLAEADKLLRVARRNTGEGEKPPASASGAAAAASAAIAAAASKLAAASAGGGAKAASKPGASTSGASTSAPRGRPGGGGISETLALLQAKGAVNPTPVPEEEKEEEDAAAAPTPAPAAAPAAAAAPRAVMAESIEKTTETAAVLMAAAMKRRTPNAQHVDVSRGGLQVVAPTTRKRTAAAGEASMPPPSSAPAAKRVYGAARPPPGGAARLPAPSRDEGIEASGEGDEPEG